MPIFPIPGNVTPGGQILASDLTELYNGINGGLDSANIVTGGLAGTAFAAGTISFTKLKQGNANTGIQQPVSKHSNGAYFPLPNGIAPGFGTLFFPGIATDNATGTKASWSSMVTPANDGSATNFDTGFLVSAGFFGPGYLAGPQTTPQFILWLAVFNQLSTGTNQAFLFNNYLQSSPPYDLGDGEIPLFAFILRDKSGNPVLTSLSQDPPWGAPYIRKPKMTTSLQEALDDPTKIDAYLNQLDIHVATKKGIAGMRARVEKGVDPSAKADLLKTIASMESLTYEPQPDTQEYKNSLMPTYPHPFVHNDIVNGWGLNEGPLTPVLLDPVDKNTERLALLHASGENVNALIHQGHISLGNTHLSNRKGPPGVMIVSHKFKNSGGR